MSYNDQNYEGIDVLSGDSIRVQVADGRIGAVESLAQGTTNEATTNSLSGSELTSGQVLLCPGFIDIQLNGFAGIDYSSPGLDTARIEQVIRAVGASGTTRHLATIITSPRGTITSNCAAIAKARRESPLAHCGIIGIHIEGPFISPQDGARGAHNIKHVRNPDYDEFREWQEAAEGAIRIVTLAPETEGALDFISNLTAGGVIASIGHTAATPEQIRAAVAAGARLSTHLGNGCSAMLPRLKNFIWSQLAEDRLCASIIADGFHLPDEVIQVFSRAKGLERLILVSDAAFLAGSAPGVYQWGGTSVEVHADGHLGLQGTEFLAGAGHLLNRGIAHFARVSGAGLRETVALCSANPARLLGLSPEATSFVPGAPACLTRFRPAREGSSQVEIEACVIAGQVIHGS
jgi:N-acetylglucosamine-6-phosphate deacetylase